MGYTNDELAAIFAKPSRDAARMAVARALARLAEVMSASTAPAVNPTTEFKPSRAD
jgi:hypothetical protein